MNFTKKKMFLLLVMNFNVVLRPGSARSVNINELYPHKSSHLSLLKLLKCHSNAQPMRDDSLAKKWEKHFWRQTEEWSCCSAHMLLMQHLLFRHPADQIALPHQKDLVEMKPRSITDWFNASNWNANLIWNQLLCIIYISKWLQEQRLHGFYSCGKVTLKLDFNLPVMCRQKQEVVSSLGFNMDGRTDGLTCSCSVSDPGSDVHILVSERLTRNWNM